MKTLVTGSMGFIGTHLMEVLDDAVGYDIKAGQDVRDAEQLYSYMRDVKTVIHLAAQTSIANAWDDPAELYSHNVLGTANVIQQAARCKIQRVIYASSASVYQPNDNPYSLSKWMGEAMFETHKDQIESIGMRFMNVYGKGQNRDYGTVIPAFYEGIKSKKGIHIYGRGTQTRDFIHVSDIVRFIQIALDHPIKGKHHFLDVGTGKDISINDLAELFQKKMHKTKVTHDRARKEVLHSKAGIKEQKKMGFKPKITLSKGLDLIIKEGI